MRNAPAGGDGVAVASEERNGRDLVVRDDDEPRFRVGAFAPHDPQVGDRRLVARYLDLFDDDGLHFAERVVRLGVDGPHDFPLVY